MTQSVIKNEIYMSARYIRQKALIQVLVIPSWYCSDVVVVFEESEAGDRVGYEARVMFARHAIVHLEPAVVLELNTILTPVCVNRLLVSSR